jgi:hypothetical protein
MYERVSSNFWKPLTKLRTLEPFLKKILAYTVEEVKEWG